MKVSKREIIKELESILDVLDYEEPAAKRLGRVEAITEALIEKMQDYGTSEGRQEGIAKARTARTQKTKEKVQNAINLLRIEGKEITPYQIAKVANISYNTAKKYLDTIEAPAV